MMSVSAVIVSLVIAKPLLMRLNETRDNNDLEPVETKFPSRCIQDNRLLVMCRCGVSSCQEPCNTADSLLPDRRKYRCTGNCHCIGYTHQCFCLVVNGLLKWIAFNVQYDCI